MLIRHAIRNKFWYRAIKYQLHKKWQWLLHSLSFYVGEVTRCILELQLQWFQKSLQPVQKVESSSILSNSCKFEKVARKRSLHGGPKGPWDSKLY